MVVATNDVYRWRVTYDDGTVVDECDEERPEGRGWAEILPDIDVKMVDRITLVPNNTSLPEQNVHIPNTKPMFFRRRRIAVDPIIGTQFDIGTVHCIGWGDDPSFDTVGEAYLFVFEDGSTFLTDDLQAV